MRSIRSKLALLYLLTTIVAQGMHTHGGLVGTSRVGVEVSFDQSPVGDDTVEQDHCVACGFLAEHQAIDLLTSYLFDPAIEARSDLDTPPVRQFLAVPSRGRGPPRV